MLFLNRYTLCISNDIQIIVVCFLALTLQRVKGMLAACRFYQLPAGKGSVCGGEKRISHVCCEYLPPLFLFKLSYATSVINFAFMLTVKYREILLIASVRVDLQHFHCIDEDSNVCMYICALGVV